MPPRQTAKKTAPPPAPDEPDVPDADADADAPDEPDADAQDAPGTAVQQAYVDALLREREGYVRYGREDRVKDVDAELKRLGVRRPAAHRGTERAVPGPPETA